MNLLNLTGQSFGSRRGRRHGRRRPRDGLRTLGPSGSQWSAFLGACGIQAYGMRRNLMLQAVIAPSSEQHAVDIRTNPEGDRLVPAGPFDLPHAAAVARA